VLTLIGDTFDSMLLRVTTDKCCYAQIGGLAVATFITLLLVPVFLQHRRAGFEDREMGDRKARRGTRRELMISTLQMHSSGVNQDRSATSPPFSSQA
jgi:hypothetical protein